MIYHYFFFPADKWVAAGTPQNDYQPSFSTEVVKHGFLFCIGTESINTYLNFSAEFSPGDNHEAAKFPRAGSDYSRVGT